MHSECFFGKRQTLNLHIYMNVIHKYAVVCRKTAGYLKGVSGSLIRAIQDSRYQRPAMRLMIFSPLIWWMMAIRM